MARLRWIGAGAPLLMLSSSGCTIPVAQPPQDEVEHTQAAAPAVADPTPKRRPTFGPFDLRQLPVSAFPELPAALAEFLAERHCTIPQVSRQQEKANVIQGEFFAAGEPGWAVICSHNGWWEILVFRSDSDRDPVALASSEDPNCENAEWDCGFWTAIYSADREKILYYEKSLSGPEPPPIDHHGVEIAAVGKASSIRYFYRGEWLWLQGGD